MALFPEEIIKAWRERYSSASRPAIYRAPGRVNLIGEHTDYNLGFVFPTALAMSCYVAIAPAEHGRLRIYSREMDATYEVPVAEIAAQQRTGAWHDYVIGVAQQLERAGYPISAADIWISSEVPAGSGLSSSAALEVSTTLALLNGRDMPKLDVARLAQRAEIEFVGMPCGIMDQYASVFGREHSAIKIDCRDLTHTYAQLPENVSIIAVNSQVKHELGTSAYRERVAECREAVEAVQKSHPEVRSLRDVSLSMLEQVQDSIPIVPRKRARHIVSDSERVLLLADAAEAGDLREMGRLFIASHRSMQYDYEITCEEIDFLVDTAIKLPGVYGARMTGGGFGGCTVNLIEPEQVADFERALTEAYQKRFNITPLFYECRPAAGAERIA